MKKKKLSIEKLKVSSFVTDVSKQKQETAKGGNDATGWGYCDTEWAHCSVYCTGNICHWTDKPVQCYGNGSNVCGDGPEPVPIDANGNP